MNLDNNPMKKLKKIIRIKLKMNLDNNPMKKLKKKYP